MRHIPTVWAVYTTSTFPFATFPYEKNALEDQGKKARPEQGSVDRSRRRYRPARSRQGHLHLDEGTQHLELTKQPLERLCGQTCVSSQGRFWSPNYLTRMALPGFRGDGRLIMRPGRQRGHRAGLCRAGGYCGRIERSPNRRAASPGKCRGAGAARSAATTRTLPGY
jgi:hypothetical protein